MTPAPLELPAGRPAEGLGEAPTSEGNCRPSPECGVSNTEDIRALPISQFGVKKPK